MSSGCCVDVCCDCHFAMCTFAARGSVLRYLQCNKQQDHLKHPAFTVDPLHSPPILLWHCCTGQQQPDTSSLLMGFGPQQLGNAYSQGLYCRHFVFPNSECCSMGASLTTCNLAAMHHKLRRLP